MAVLAIYCRVRITWNLLEMQILRLTLCLLEIWESENHWSHLICQNLPLSFFFLLHMSISLFTPVIFSQSWIPFLNVFGSSCDWGSPWWVVCWPRLKDRLRRRWHDVYSLSWFPWCKYSDHDWMQATHMILLQTELRRDVHNCSPEWVWAALTPCGEEPIIL